MLMWRLWTYVERHNKFTTKNTISKFVELSDISLQVDGDGAEAVRIGHWLPKASTRAEGERAGVCGRVGLRLRAGGDLAWVLPSWNRGMPEWGGLEFEDPDPDSIASARVPDWSRRLCCLSFRLVGPAGNSHQSMSVQDRLGLGLWGALGASARAER
jgi:hypothetical protein